MKSFALLLVALLLLMAPGVGAKTYDEAYQEAKVAFEAKDFARARTLMAFALILAATPHEKNHALIRIGETYKQEGNFAKALEIWQGALHLQNLQPAERFETLMAIGTGYQEAQKHQAARETFNKILQDPQVTDEARLPAQMALAKSWMDEAKYDESRAILNKVVFHPQADFSIKSAAQTWIAITFSKEGKHERAREEFSKLRDAQENHPLQWMSFIFIAGTYTSENNHAQARTELMKLLNRPTPAGLSLEDAKSFDAAKTAAHRDMAHSYIKEKNRAQAQVEIEKFGALPGVSPEDKAALQKELDDAFKAGAK